METIELTGSFAHSEKEKHQIKALDGKMVAMLKPEELDVLIYWHKTARKCKTISLTYRNLPAEITKHVDQNGMIHEQLVDIAGGSVSVPLYINNVYIEVTDANETAKQRRAEFKLIKNV